MNRIGVFLSVAKVAAVDSFSLPAETIVSHSENGPIHTHVDICKGNTFFVATPHKMAPETELSKEDSIQEMKTADSFDTGQCRRLLHL